MLAITLYNGANPEMLGMLPQIFGVVEHEGKTAKEMVNLEYGHGGGWHPFGGDKWSIQHLLGQDVLSYGTDDDAEAYRIVASWKVGDETVRLWEGSWVSITQKDGAFEVSRMD
jgi:hypothetical protein